MKNFWANGNNRSNSESVFGKKSGLSTPTPPTAGAPLPKTSSSSRMAGLSSRTPAPIVSPLTKIRFDHDFACGVFVGAFAIPSMVVTLEVVEITDPVLKKVDRTDNWLNTNDMLAILTREYGKAQQKLAAATGAARDEATRRVTEVRDQVVCVLHSRRAYHRAKDAGIRILLEP